MQQPVVKPRVSDLNRITPGFGDRLCCSTTPKLQPCHQARHKPQARAQTPQPATRNRNPNPSPSWAQGPASQAQTSREAFSSNLKGWVGNLPKLLEQIYPQSERKYPQPERKYPQPCANPKTSRATPHQTTFLNPEQCLFSRVGLGASEIRGLRSNSRTLCSLGLRTFSYRLSITTREAVMAGGWCERELRERERERERGREEERERERRDAGRGKEVVYDRQSLSACCLMLH